jgi:hypothetical protein
MTTLTVGDQEFPEFLLTQPADQRMSLMNLNSVANYVNRRNGIRWRILDEKISHSFQVGKCASRVNYFRHVLTFGCLVRSPRTRAAM